MSIHVTEGLFIATKKPILYKRISVEYCKHEGSD